MINSHIKRVLSIAVLTAFLMPTGISAPLYEANSSANGVSNALSLSSASKLTDKNSKITLSLRDSDVKQVLRMFADKAGMNIVFHESAKGNITLDLVDVPLSTAFDMIMGITNLNYVVEDNTIFVAKSDAKDFNMAKQDMTIVPVKYVSAGALAEF